MDTIQHQASIMHQAGHCIKPHIETVDFPGDTGAQFDDKIFMDSWTVNSPVLTSWRRKIKSKEKRDHIIINDMIWFDHIVSYLVFLALG